MGNDLLYQKLRMRLTVTMICNAQILKHLDLSVEKKVGEGGGEKKKKKKQIING